MQVACSSLKYSLPRNCKRYFLLHHPYSTRRRQHYSSKAPKSVRHNDVTATESPAFVQDNFAKPTVLVLNFGKRFIKFSLISLLLLGATVGAVFEGGHMWVENIDMATEKNDEVKKWEWDLGREHWITNRDLPGTDSALSVRARHLIRAAWIANSYGVGKVVVGDRSSLSAEATRSGGLQVADARLRTTEHFLRDAILMAETNNANGQLKPFTFPDLLIRHSLLLERLGQGNLSQARINYRRAWAGLPGEGLLAAYVALKLGDLNSRLDESKEALEWWRRAVVLTKAKGFGEEYASSSTIAPESPLAQRILATVLVSLSAYFSKAGALRNAQKFQEDSLCLLRSIPVPKSLASASPPQTLHTLFLLQRSSLLSVHLAEVMHAQSQPNVSVKWLASAAESSERVAYALMGFNYPPPRGLHEKDSSTRPNKTQLLPVYINSRSMKNAAISLLRDSRRTAAEAWNLMGVIYEDQEGPKSKAAFECYERAVEWAGTATDNNGVRTAGDETLESDWKVIWGNYVRTKRMNDQPMQQN